MRRFYEYALVLSLIAVAVVTAVVLTNAPPEQPAVALDRPGDDPVAIFEGPSRSGRLSVFEDRPRPSIDVERDCLTLDDGRDFVCSAQQGEPAP